MIPQILRQHKRVLIDNGVWIYHFEQHPEFVSHRNSLGRDGSHHREHPVAGGQVAAIASALFSRQDRLESDYLGRRPPRTDAALGRDDSGGNYLRARGDASTCAEAAAASALKSSRVDRLILAANISCMGRTLRSQVALYLDDEQIELLHKLARHSGRTKQDLLREAVNTLFAEYGAFKLVKRRTSKTKGADNGSNN